MLESTFAKDQHRLQWWEKRLQRRNFKVPEASRICSKHFEPGCFDNTKTGGRWLTNDAVPILFKFPQPPHELEESNVDEKAENSETCEETEVESITKSSVVHVEEKNLPRKKLRYIGDSTEVDMLNSVRAHKFFKVAKEEQGEVERSSRRDLLSEGVHKQNIGNDGAP
ncbi:hypothetical protein CDAR_470421 [Caerostris darwini]|uniref:THAP-type domain-containing protein n=1 Tax=Caerostris darwini TaxID=1538125 RepID=A0AAV4VH96_9ARAC|nr:hypothetical protein CDAR_470421 [Caerostris darwini]